MKGIKTLGAMRPGAIGKCAIGLMWSVLFFSGTVCLAQNAASGDIRGTVIDSSGAVIPGVTVTVLNNGTGVSLSYTTNASGLYDTSSIVLGNYTLTFTKSGFKQLVRGPVTVQAGYTTVNVQLTVGAVSQEVVVKENVPLLTTESPEQSTTLEAHVLEQLPETGQDWENFVVLSPGATGTASAASTYPTPDNPQEAGVSVNGNLPYYNVTLDGASVILVNAGNNNVIPLEDVAEVQMQTSTFSAQSGIGGVQYNQISKGGTDKFHGAAYEYFQNDALNAADYGFGNRVSVPFLRYDNFGGAVGGPIVKKKLFLYFNWDETYTNSGAVTGFATFPTLAEMSGDFTGTNANGVPYPTLYDPSTQVITETGTVTQPDGTVQTCPCVTRKSFAQEYGDGNRIPASMISPVAKAAEALFPTPANHPSTGFFVPGSPTGTGVTVDNYYYSLPTAYRFPIYFGRLDYDISSGNRLSITDNERYWKYDAPSAFAYPIGWQGESGENNNASVQDVWTISPHVINQARFGFTDALDYYADDTINKHYPQQLGLSYAESDALPSFTMGGYNSIAPAANAVLKEFTFDPSDVVTLIKGRNILHFGGEFLAYENNATAWGNEVPGTFNFGGSYTAEYVGSPDTGFSYADFLLGDSSSWYAEYVPEYGARYKTPQMFVQNDIKVKPNLTLNLGIRYVIQHGLSEVHNDESSFDPTIVNPATNTLGAMWFGTTHANGRKTLGASIWDSFLPRVGLAWEPDNKTTVRGGFGLYDYNYSLGTRGGLNMGGVSLHTGYVSDLTNGITPVVNLAGVDTPSEPALYTASELPYAVPSTSPDSWNGQTPYYEPYHTPDMKIEQWSVALQRMVTMNMVAELAYVGSHGLNLPFNSDINQVPEGKLGIHDNPAGRPYPQFQNIYSETGNSSAWSNYNSLQVSVTQRATSGLSFTFNYVWSHLLDVLDSSTWQGDNQGTLALQNSFDPGANYGASNFDVRNAIKGYATYQLPFGVGRRYMNGTGLYDRLRDGVLGGWNISAIARAQSGTPFTPMIPANLSYAQDGDWYPNVVGNPKLRHPSITTGWFNPEAFASPEEATFGNARRNSLYGPDLTDVDMSLGKTFALTEGIKWEIRADASNVLNHPSFGDPNYNLTCPTPGAVCPASDNLTNDVSLTNDGRSMQLGARLSF